MSNEFMARLLTCGQCGEKYMPAHQSAECPHPRLVDVADKVKQELREEVADIIYNWLKDDSPPYKPIINLVDQILALIPDGELIRKDERERIIAWGIEPCPHWHMYPDVGVIKRDCSQCWQALKGEGKAKNDRLPTP